MNIYMWIVDVRERYISWMEQKRRTSKCWQVFEMQVVEGRERANERREREKERKRGERIWRNDDDDDDDNDGDDDDNDDDDDDALRREKLLDKCGASAFLKAWGNFFHCESVRRDLRRWLIAN
ncbi:PREDICTED: LOW QUALITY PROTEIN: protein FAM50A-like [Vollenhovia emeryi]|uniref:LOW QUALITY PROTEIN: protein FAM50A-like n=1 Tax=Vollenhovia emeryi TaxID=411798 RepID=UPI0005F3722E|nr:PREDICTED: LOW QUALITY PROTEIN: protein FAM50A-like [Vollenhovia emeryi]